MPGNTILIVEDNAMNMDIAVQLLSFEGYQILQADSCDSCLEITKIQKPDLILLDMHLPVVDGFEICRRLKADPKTKDIIVLAFTALAMEEDHKKALDSGCDGIINKPIDVETFAKTVGGYLK